MVLLNTAGAVRLGTKVVKNVYLGPTKVWPSGFDPKSLPGLVVWLDAGKNSSGPLGSAWPDLSGLANHQGNVVGSPPPVVVPNVLNNKSVVRFTVSEGRIRGRHDVHLSGLPNAPYNYTVLYVTRFRGPNVGRAFTTIYPSSGNFLVGFHSSAQDCMYAEGWVTQGIGYAGSPGPWKLYGATGKHDGIYEVRFYKDGVMVHEGGGGGSIGTEYALSGYDANATQETMDCDIAEFLIWNRKLADAERQQVELYLKTKYGL